MLWPSLGFGQIRDDIYSATVHYLPTQHSQDSSPGYKHVDQSTDLSSIHNHTLDGKTPCYRQ